jgi:hypothetical protein
VKERVPSLSVIVLLAVTIVSCRTEKSGPLRLAITEWNPSYTQGVHSVHCVLVNTGPTNVTLRDWETTHPSLNAATCLGKDSRHFIILTDAVPYNPNATTELVLRAGEQIEVAPESVFDAQPGDYQMFVILQSDTGVRSEPRRIHLKPGTVKRPHK